MKRIKSLILLFLVLSSILCFSSIPGVLAQSYIFESDMDQADFSDWDYRDVEVVQVQDPVFHGSNAANFTEFGAALIEHPTSSTANPMYVNFFIRFEGLPAAGVNVTRWMLYVITDTDGETISVLLYNDGGTPQTAVMCLYSSDLDDFQTGSTPIVSGQWHEIQVKAETSASTDCRLWVDGNLDCTITGDNSGTGDFDQVWFNIADGMNFGEFDAAYLDWVIVDDEPISTLSVSADLEDVDDDAADWVFTDWKYYEFTVTIGGTGYDNVTMYFTIPTAFENITCGFFANSTDWIYASNMSYEARVGEPVLLQAGTWTETADTTVTYNIWFQDHVQDVWLPAAAIPITVSVDAGASQTAHSGLFRIYSEGGFQLNSASSNSSLAYILPGGSPFSFHVEDDGTTQSMYNEIWFRDVQHLKLLPEIHFDANDGNQFDIRYGVDYSFGEGEWLTGWYLDITPHSVHYNGLFTAAVWINMSAYVYDRFGVVSQEDLYMYIHGDQSAAGKPGWWEVWFDLWVSDKNASSVGAGRINAYEYGMEDQADLWLRWLANNWAPMDDVYKEWSGEVPILASDNSTIMSSETVVMWRYWSTVRVFTTGSGQIIEIRNFEHFDDTRSSQLPMTGISAPVFEETIVPVVGSKGLLGALWTMFAAIGSFLSENILFGGLNLWGAFVGFLDTIAGMFGAPRFFTNLFSWIADLIGYLVNSATDMATLLSDLFPLFTALIGTFLTTMGDLVSSLLSTLTTFLDMMGGAYGVGVNIWDDMGISTWLMLAMVFYPIYLIFLWDEKGLDAVLSQLSMLFGILSWLYNFFVSLISFVIRLVTSIIESIPIAE